MGASSNGIFGLISYSNTGSYKFENRHSRSSNQLNIADPTPRLNQSVDEIECHAYLFLWSSEVMIVVAEYRWVNGKVNIAIGQG